jgi:hypothetical protein
MQTQYFHVWGVCVTNNNVFWGGWLDLLTLLLQLQPIITAHNQWLSKTRSVPYWTTSVFSSAVTHLVLIYESVTSSAFAVRWLTLHSWALKSLTTELRLNQSSLHSHFYNLACIHGKHLLLASIHGKYMLLGRIHGNCLLISPWRRVGEWMYRSIFSWPRY